MRRAPHLRKVGGATGNPSGDPHGAEPRLGLGHQHGPIAGIGKLTDSVMLPILILWRRKAARGELSRWPKTISSAQADKIIMGAKLGIELWAQAG